MGRSDARAAAGTGDRLYRCTVRGPTVVGKCSVGFYSPAVSSAFSPRNRFLFSRTRNNYYRHDCCAKFSPRSRVHAAAATPATRFNFYTRYAQQLLLDTAAAAAAACLVVVVVASHHHRRRRPERPRLCRPLAILYLERGFQNASDPPPPLDRPAAPTAATIRRLHRAMHMVRGCEGQIPLEKKKKTNRSINTYLFGFSALNQEHAQDLFLGGTKIKLKLFFYSNSICFQV